MYFQKSTLVKKMNIFLYEEKIAMGIDTVFHDSIKIFGGDEAVFEEVLEVLEAFAKSNGFCWNASVEGECIDFKFKSSWRVNADTAGHHLLNVANLLKEHGFTGSSVAAFTTCCGDMEAGCLFFEVTDESATVKVSATDCNGKWRKFAETVALKY